MINLSESWRVKLRLLASPLAIAIFVACNIAFYSYFLQRSDRLVVRCNDIKAERAVRDQKVDLAELRNQIFRVEVFLIGKLGEKGKADSDQMAILDIERNLLRRDIKTYREDSVKTDRQVKQVCKEMDDVRGRANMVLLIMNLCLTLYAFWAGTHASREMKNG